MSRDFSTRDLEQLDDRGVAIEAAVEQLALMRNPPVPIVLDRPCTIGDGIERIMPEDEQAFLERSAVAEDAGRIMKFVPASGAASRMFKDLIAALAGTARPSESRTAADFFANIDRFPFAEELRRRASVHGAVVTEEAERKILGTLLEEMAFASKPKGLIPFHDTGTVRSAFEEHLLEGARYTQDSGGVSRMHFTVSPEYLATFETMLAPVAAEAKQRSGALVSVTFSEQHPSTDTLAIDEKGEPFRDEEGALLFRPGGHGALLHNLERTGGDIVVIKNIDNIVPEQSSDEPVRWKRLLIGYIVRLQSEVFAMLEACSSRAVAQETLDRALELSSSKFARRPPESLTDRESKRLYVIEALDRPLRVCGVVRNEGEPGGAPFWVREPDGHTSVQIVESSQVNMSDAEQLRIFKASTHFNPVDIVCALRNYRGEPFALQRFVDSSTVFLSKKSYGGRELTALERPGLWNGAMAQWNTICVEVPAETFAPVKTVLDLLRPQHQPR